MASKLHDFTGGRKCRKCGMDAIDADGGPCAVATAEVTTKQMESAIKRLSRFAEWSMRQENGPIRAIIESYVQKFVSHADNVALRSIIMERLNITSEEIAEKALEELERTIGMLQLNFHIILTPDGVLKE
jgi:hypothetical protein